MEAINHLRQGLAVLRTLPDTPERLQQELDLQVAIGPALIATQGNAALEVEHAYARARELCQQVGNPPQLFPVFRGLMLYYINRGDLETAYQLGEQLLRLAHSQPDPAPRMPAHYMRGWPSLLVVNRPWPNHTIRRPGDLYPAGASSPGVALRL